MMLIDDKIRNDNEAWPDVTLSRWAETKRSLHLYAQMFGKIKLVLSPIQPNWMFTALHLTPRGLTTGTIAWHCSSLDVLLDVFSSEIVVTRSTGARIVIPLLPVRTVAEVYHDLTASLEKVGVNCFISRIPQEVPDTTPLDADRRSAEYDPDAVMRWFQAATATTGVFDEWRSRFFGRAPLQVWWGALDVALLLFSGRRVNAPTDRGYIAKYDLDAELMNVGLYLGDQGTPPFFYGYIYPQPGGVELLPIAPQQASWSATLQEWVLPYEVVRTSEHPTETLCMFIDAIYAQCFAAAGWDRNAHSYEAPKIRNRGVPSRLAALDSS
jgi:Family of unknown function (DUF5996)